VLSENGMGLFPTIPGGYHQVPSGYHKIFILKIKSANFTLKGFPGHPREILAKIDSKLDMKVNICKDPFIFLVTYWNLLWKLDGFDFFSLETGKFGSKFLMKNPLYRLKSKFSVGKMIKIHLQKNHWLSLLVLLRLFNGFLWFH
jgi:hypothetical protein